MNYFEFEKRIEEIKKTLSARSGHSIDMGTRLLDNLLKDMESRLKKIEEFERIVSGWKN